MTFEAILAIALTCKTLPVSLAPIMAGIAMQESGGDPRIVNHNPNGTSDFGLAQVNTVNLGWTHLTNPFDPCANLTAGAKVLFSRYNGNPPDSIKALYAAGIMTRLTHMPIPPIPVESIPTPPIPVGRHARPVMSGRDLLATRR
jgi:soluble lytic murein transglycosylase-like protein